MRLLLDTHVWLWCLLEPKRLTPRVRRVLRKSDSELWLSPITLWETLILAEKGRLDLDGDPQIWIDDALERAPMNEAPITHEIVRESRRVPVPHEDSADRFLAATSRVLNLTLVTADRILLATPDLSVLPNR